MQRVVQAIKEAHSNIIVFMRKRMELVNKLIDITKGYGDHEKFTHISVTQAEHSHTESHEVGENVQGIIHQIASFARNYPELKANVTYQQLMVDLKEIETGLQQKRESYNAQVRVYNTRRSQIPFVFVASKLGFQAVPYFNVEDEASLDRLKDFASEDGAHLRASLAELSESVTRTSQRLSQGGIHLIEKGIAAGKSELEKRRAEKGETAEGETSVSDDTDIDISGKKNSG
jgi:LemA protein